MKLTKPASVVLLSGLGIRLGLAPFTGHPGDIALFIVLLSFTRKLIPSTLFFLNPFPILLSAVWGTYDSMMLFPLLLGLYIFATRNDRPASSLVFVVSGLLKLFGFVSFALAVC